MLGFWGGVLISMRYLSVCLVSLGPGRTALVGRPAGVASLWDLMILVLGWEMADVFSTAVGISIFLSKSRGFSWEHVYMRCSYVRLGFFRALETEVGLRPLGEVLMLVIWIFCLGWRPSFWRR